MSQGLRDSAVPFAADDLSVANMVREFNFTDADFRFLAQHAYDQAGIVLSDSKRNLVYGRLSRRLRTLGLTSFAQYREYLVDTPSELEGFINAISTNLTKFFRESHHFDHFRTQVVVPFAQAAAGRSGLRFRVWSAGCSTGEEPYTIAVVLRHEFRELKRHDVRILATDIDTDVLSKGSRGEYPAESLADVPASYREHFRASTEAAGRSTSLASDELKSLIVFRRLNLMERWPFSGQFDAIFCRNVMIYFDTPTKTNLVDRFVRQIKPGGFLYIGHSESLLGAHPDLQLVGRTIYRREK
jgi:chemotaxis protein methyltransferase CheR